MRFLTQTQPLGQRQFCLPFRNGQIVGDYHKMPISEKEKLAIADLLIEEEQNIHILLKLAHGVTGKVVDIASAQGTTVFGTCQSMYFKLKIIYRSIGFHLHTHCRCTNST